MPVFWIFQVLSIVVLVIEIFFIIYSFYDNSNFSLTPVFVSSFIAIGLSYVSQFLSYYLGGV